MLSLGPDDDGYYLEVCVEHLNPRLCWWWLSSAECCGPWHGREADGATQEAGWELGHAAQAPRQSKQQAGGTWTFLSRDRLGRQRRSRLRKKYRGSLRSRGSSDILTLGGQQRRPCFHTDEGLPQEKDTLRLSTCFSMKAFLWEEICGVKGNASLPGCAISC